MSDKHQFKIFRYQILPISREFQPELGEDKSVIEDLLAQKNSIFWQTLSAVPDFSNNHAAVTHQVTDVGSDIKVFKLAVFRHLRRETRDFKSEHIENWPSIHVFVFNDPMAQYIIVESRPEAFQLPETAVRQLFNPLNARLAQRNLRTHFEPVVESKVFWDTIEKNTGKVQEVSFELITPNMANISQTLNEEVKNLAKSTNTATTQLALKADKASSLTLNKSDPSISGLVDYSSEGGGNITIRLKGVKKAVQTKKTVRTIEIDSIELNVPVQAVGIVKALLGL